MREMAPLGLGLTHLELGCLAPEFSCRRLLQGQHQLPEPSLSITFEDTEAQAWLKTNLDPSLLSVSTFALVPHPHPQLC